MCNCSANHRAADIHSSSAQSRAILHIQLNCWHDILIKQIKRHGTTLFLWRMHYNSTYYWTWGLIDSLNGLYAFNSNKKFMRPFEFNVPICGFKTRTENKARGSLNCTVRSDFQKLCIVYSHRNNSLE